MSSLLRLFSVSITTSVGCEEKNKSLSIQFNFEDEKSTNWKNLQQYYFSFSEIRHCKQNQQRPDALLMKQQRFFHHFAFFIWIFECALCVCICEKSYLCCTEREQRSFLCNNKDSATVDDDCVCMLISDNQK